MVELFNTIKTNVRNVISNERQVVWDNTNSTISKGKTIYQIHSQITHSPLLLDVLWHNIASRSIEGFCHEVGEFSGMCTTETYDLTGRGCHISHHCSISFSESGLGSCVESIDFGRRRKQRG